MNRNDIAIRKLNKAYLLRPKLAQPDSRAMTLQANIMSLGYMMDSNLLEAVSGLPTAKLQTFAKELVSTLSALKGANVTYAPMYPNFPAQVMNASSMELFLNAIVHYLSSGRLMPNYEKLPREFAFEHTEFKVIGLATEEEFASIFTKILGSNESISEQDKNIVKWFLDSYGNLVFPDDMPFKENMCLIGAYMIENDISIYPIVKNATDVLRIATHMSDGDVSLAGNTKFRNFKRRERRELTLALERVGTEEDIVRHAGKWVRLAHGLHVGDYSAKAYSLLESVRNNIPVRTFASDVEQHLEKEQPVKVIKRLVERPGDFARRLDHVLRMAKTVRNQTITVNKFLSVADAVSTRVLIQLLGHFKRRAVNVKKRVVFPKGSIQNAKLIDGLEALPETVVTQLTSGITSLLIERFKEQYKEPMGKVYIDESLKDCPIPSQQRSASAGTFEVTRGTKLPLGDDKDTLRFFIYWKGVDIDLSTVAFDENLNCKGHISYTQLRSTDMCHSGDITNAPYGASEFIDINMSSALNRGIRYVSMNVLVYYGPTFAEHETVYAGWMTRSAPDSNEVYDPKTVNYKMDLTMNTRKCIPVIFDLKERKAIWTDLGESDNFTRPNNVENNAVSIKNVVEALTTKSNKISLYELFYMHAMAAGEIVEDREDADIVFAWDGDVKPSDISVIGSDYIA